MNADKQKNADMPEDSAQKTASIDEFLASGRGTDLAIEIPEIEYKPARPKKAPAKIGLIGCGGIAPTHLKAYRDAGYDVVALFDRHPQRAEKLRNEYYPAAKIFESAAQFFADGSFSIADITPHPVDRVELIEIALENGKHVLSQKPFAVDLDVARRLVELAETKNLKLAVNQNGRWAAHVSFARNAIAAGLLGDIVSVDMAVYWDHNWCAGTPFDRVKHLLLYDFAIHWFDMACCYFGEKKAQRVFANLNSTTTQKAVPPLAGQVLVEFDDGGQTSLVFRGDSKWCPRDRTVILGADGALVSDGPHLNEQSVELILPAGVCRPELETVWFDDGFDGTMSELICAIEEDRPPSHSGRNNLKTLELCFAAVASAESGQPMEVGSIARLEPAWNNLEP